MSEYATAFKAYLQTEGQREVRRFTIDRDAVSSFCYLQEKLNTVFPSIRNTRVTIAWKDEEGDEVVISSDEELIIALNEMEAAEVKKLYLYSGSQTTDKNSGVAHVDVTCDGCHESVFGFRYKCIVCPSFDLCLNCESLGLHPEHFMLRIPVCLSSRGLGRKSGRWLHKLSKRQWASEKGHRHADKFSCGEKFTCGEKFSSGDKPEKSGRCSFRAGEGWIDHLTTVLADLTSPPAPSPNTPSADPTRILWNLRQGIANLLDPLGGEVHGQSSSSAGQQDQASGVSPKSDDKGVPREEPMESEEAGQGEGKKGSGAEGQRGESSGAEGRKEENGETSGKMDVPSAVPQRAEKESSKRASPQYKTVIPPDSSWTVIDQSPIQAGPTTFPFRQFPGVPQSSGGGSNRIEESLEKMLSMGFNNEGDWLRQMLVQKDGNIEQVLDTLLPMRKFTVK